MANSIIRPRDFQAEKLVVHVDRMKTLETQQKIVPVSYEGRPLVFQTAEMVVPFGLSKYYPKDAQGNVNKEADPKVTLELSFRNMETKPNVKLFFDAISQFDAIAKKSAFENSFTLFRKKLSEDNVGLMYSPGIRVAVDKETGEVTDKYPPTFRMTIPCKGGRYGTTVYTKDREDVTDRIDEYLVKSAKVSALVQCTGLWIAGKGFGCSWKVIQIVASPPERIQGYAFLDDPVDDADADDDLEADEAHKSDSDESTPPVAAVPQAPTNQVADSDEDNDDEEDPAPKTLQKKVTVRRQKK